MTCCRKRSIEQNSSSIVNIVEVGINAACEPLKPFKDMVKPAGSFKTMPTGPGTRVNW